MPDQKDETAALRAEIEELRAKVPADGDGGAGGSPGRRKGWWRPVASGLILVLVVLLSPLCIVAAWAHREISQTDTYVSTVAPLASDPAIQDAISDRVTAEIFNYVDIPAVTTQAIDALAAQGLPATAETGLRALSVPLDSAVQNFVHERVDNLVRSPAFADAWEAANREAHAQLVLALTGESDGTVAVSGNTVSVNLATFIEAAKQQLIAKGFTVVERIPEVNASFVIFEAKNLEKAQRGFRLLDTISTVLPIITILLVVAASLHRAQPQEGADRGVTERRSRNDLAGPDPGRPQTALSQCDSNRPDSDVGSRGRVRPARPLHPDQPSRRLADRAVDRLRGMGQRSVHGCREAAPRVGARGVGSARPPAVGLPDRGVGRVLGHLPHCRARRPGGSGRALPALPRPGHRKGCRAHAARRRHRLVGGGAAGSPTTSRCVAHRATPSRTRASARHRPVTQFR